jgi:hypothetical protein
MASDGEFSESIPITESVVSKSCRSAKSKYNNRTNYPTFPEIIFGWMQNHADDLNLPDDLRSINAFDGWLQNMLYSCTKQDCFLEHDPRDSYVRTHSEGTHAMFFRVFLDIAFERPPLRVFFDLLCKPQTDSMSPFMMIGMLTKTDRGAVRFTTIKYTENLDNFIYVSLPFASANKVVHDEMFSPKTVTGIEYLDLAPLLENVIPPNPSSKILVWGLPPPSQNPRRKRGEGRRVCDDDEDDDDGGWNDGSGSDVSTADEEGERASKKKPKRKFPGRGAAPVSKKKGRGVSRQADGDEEAAPSAPTLVALASAVPPPPPPPSEVQPPQEFVPIQSVLSLPAHSLAADDKTRVYDFSQMASDEKQTLLLQLVRNLKQHDSDTYDKTLTRLGLMRDPSSDLCAIDGLIPSDCRDDYDGDHLDLQNAGNNELPIRADRVGTAIDAIPEKYKYQGDGYPKNANGDLVLPPTLLQMLKVACNRNTAKELTKVIGILKVPTLIWLFAYQLTEEIKPSGRGSMLKRLTEVFTDFDRHLKFYYARGCEYLDSGLLFDSNTQSFVAFDSEADSATMSDLAPPAMRERFSEIKRLWMDQHGAPEGFGRYMAMKEIMEKMPREFEFWYAARENLPGVREYQQRDRMKDPGVLESIIGGRNCIRAAILLNTNFNWQPTFPIVKTEPPV